MHVICTNTAGIRIVHKSIITGNVAVLQLLTDWCHIYTAMHGPEHLHTKM